MISNKMKASARILGAGLLALAVSAPAALAQGKGGGGAGPQCPFTSKDVDNWYKAAGFDTKDPDAGLNGTADCQSDGQQASMSQFSKVPGFVVFEGQNVPALTMDKSILVYVNSAGDNPINWAYTVDAMGDGFSLLVNDEPLSLEEAQLCHGELVNSQAYKRWVCPNE